MIIRNMIRNKEIIMIIIMIRNMIPGNNYDKENDEKQTNNMIPRNDNDKKHDNKS